LSKGPERKPVVFGSIYLATLTMGIDSVPSFLSLLPNFPPRPIGQRSIGSAIFFLITTGNRTLIPDYCPDRIPLEHPVANLNLLSTLFHGREINRWR
jgi:hypothetical protein